MVTRMLERKGVQYVLEAVAEPPIGAEVNIVGDGPYLPELRRRAEALRSPVNFWGWVDNRSPELRNIYESSGIFVLPSEAENFPIVLLEAMAAGLAIITTEGTGCAEVVGDAGILVPVRDSRAIASALKRLVNDPQLRQSLGAAARRRIEDNFTWGAVARRYVEEYQRHAAREVARAGGAAGSRRRAVATAPRGAGRGVGGAITSRRGRHALGASEESVLGPTAPAAQPRPVDCEGGMPMRHAPFAAYMTRSLAPRGGAGPRRIEEPLPYLWPREQAVRRVAQSVPVPGHQVVCGVADGPRQDRHDPRQVEPPSQVRRHPKRRIRAREAPVPLLACPPGSTHTTDPPGQLGMARADLGPEPSLQRREPQRATAVVSQHELDALGAEAAGTVVETGSGATAVSS